MSRLERLEESYQCFMDRVELALTVGNLDAAGKFMRRAGKLMAEMACEVERGKASQ